MRFGIGKGNVHVPRNMISLSPSDRLVFRTEDDRFYEVLNGTTRPYFDPDVGLVSYDGRQFIRTSATSFIRDGTDYFIHLPKEKTFIHRPAIASDSMFRRFDFAAEGIWRAEHCETITLFGSPERVARSVTIDGEEIVTRRNGEILRRVGQGYRSHDIAPLSSQNEFARIDLEVPHGDAARVVTLFLQPRTTPGARRWQRHLARTQQFTRQIALEGAPFIRNYNTVFYNGEQDLADCVSRLAETVDQLNAIYAPDPADEDAGALEVPTTETVSFALLNQLHFEFERFGDRLKGGDHVLRGRIEKAYGPFCKLNDRIHATEGALSNRHRTIEEAWWSLHCSFLPDLYEELDNEMYDEFTLDWDFGTMFMGYHTLGKDILAAFWNYDMDLFDRDEIRPQRISSSEIFLFLGPDTRGHLDQLNRWWDDEDISRFGYRKHDPRNALGYIPVADLIRCGRSEVDIKTMLKGCRTVLAVSLVTG